MQTIHLPAAVSRLRKQAIGAAPDLSRLSDVITEAVGDTIGAATSAASSTANTTVRRLRRQVRNRRPARRRNTPLMLVVLGGAGLAAFLLLRRNASAEAGQWQGLAGQDTSPDTSGVDHATASRNGQHLGTDSYADVVDQPAPVVTSN